jgi:hypothetical protein
MAINILTVMPDSLKARAHIIDDAMMKAKGWFDGWNESFETMDRWVDVFHDESDAKKYLDSIRSGNY